MKPALTYKIWTVSQVNNTNGPKQFTSHLCSQWNTQSWTLIYFMYLSSCSARIFAEDFASKKSLFVSSISSFPILSFPLIFDRRLAGVRSWTAYLQNTSKYNTYTLFNHPWWNWPLLLDVSCLFCQITTNLLFIYADMASTKFYRNVDHAIAF